VSTPAHRFRDALSGWFLPGALYTFVGAGGKSTALKRVGAFMAAAGVRVRLTTTTHIGLAEFEGIPVSRITGPADLERAMADGSAVRLLVADSASKRGKHRGIDPAWLEGLTLRADTVLLVEGDGSRRRSMKVPQPWEPVIPANTATVFALMGAEAFDEPIDEAHVYNHVKALSLLGKTGSFLEAAEIAALAADTDGSRKGVAAGMAFRLLVNQGDLEEKRGTASEALRLAREQHGIRGALVSLRKEELYVSTED
jgi:probable selenium-dependent hydroxylase accessory protein YqeC